MGVVKTLAYDRIPAQGTHRGERVEVLFNYDANSPLYGEIIRDDIEQPFKTVILLDDGFPIMGTECQYRPQSLSLSRFPEKAK